MPTAIAKHTIHRPGKAKGQQVVVYPGKGKDSVFECSDKEFEELLALGAVEAAEKSPAKSAAKSPAKKTAEPVKSGGEDDLGV